MHPKIEKAREIMRREGAVSLAKSIAKFVATNVSDAALVPYGMLRLKAVGPEKSPEELADFAHAGCKGLIRPGQVRREMTGLLSILKKKRPRTVLEIGTERGGTLFLFTRVASEDAQIISIDLPGGSFGSGYPSWKMPLYESFALAKQEIHLLRADSHSKATLEKAKKLLGKRKIDFLFIDGDHTYGGVKKDFDMYAPMVANGGIIALHDIAKHPKESGCEVSRFWKEVKMGRKTIEIIEDLRQGWAGIGIIIK